MLTWATFSGFGFDCDGADTLMSTPAGKQVAVNGQACEQRTAVRKGVSGQVLH